MIGTLVRMAGKKAVHKAVATQTAKRGHDFKLGFTLFRDRRVPLATKLMAIGVGIGGIALLDAIEIPAELMVTLALPLLGIPLAALDGIENVAGPVLMASFALTFLAPKETVDLIRQEQAAKNGLVIDVQPEEPTKNRVFAR